MDQRYALLLPSHVFPDSNDGVPGQVIKLSGGSMA